ncbi:uncharacterized protein METZ01_LOCUS418404 [marine metagenome]|uniref:B12-binding domain-containing protein n=1 Tax=marine metagenome TaxID=408172 RepID=A0A382X3W1_9ZZZZ
MKNAGLEDVKIFAGGIIPKQDYEELEALGIKGIFGPGTSLGDIVSYVNEI